MTAPTKPPEATEGLEQALDRERAARVNAERDAKHADERRKSARRKLKLDVAAKLRRHIEAHQRAAKPSAWTDGAVVALARAHAEIETIADDGEDEEG